MIPISAITEWREYAPWGSSAQVEHDLLLSRILVELFNNAFLSSKLAFRGGTAIHKLFLKQVVRFSEDIDLVQLKAEPIGDTLGELHQLLNSWMGEPKVKLAEGRATMIYRVQSEEENIPIRIKIEINTRDHFNVLDRIEIPFAVNNKWFSGETKINTYQLEELMATKLKALYQRKKGRDLFDFYAVVKEIGINIEEVLHCFNHYMEAQNNKVTKAQFQKNLEQKRKSKIFNTDMHALLPGNMSYEYDVEWIYQYLFNEVVHRLPGEPWKGLDK